MNKVCHRYLSIYKQGACVKKGKWFAWERKISGGISIWTRKFGCKAYAYCYSLLHKTFHEVGINELEIRYCENTDSQIGGIVEGLEKWLWSWV
jgi:hypothetical protein